MPGDEATRRARPRRTCLSAARAPISRKGVRDRAGGHAISAPEAACPASRCRPAAPPHAAGVGHGEIWRPSGPTLCETFPCASRIWTRNSRPGHIDWLSMTHGLGTRPTPAAVEEAQRRAARSRQAAGAGFAWTACSIADALRWRFGASRLTTACTTGPRPPRASSPASGASRPRGDGRRQRSSVEGRDLFPPHREEAPAGPGMMRPRTACRASTRRLWRGLSAPAGRGLSGSASTSTLSSTTRRA